MAEQETQAPAVTDGAVHHDAGVPHVLLVDDQPARLLTYEAILEGVGVQCVRAESGEQALGRLLRQEFALVLLDVSMPGMDGFETARMIREHPRYERTPIIFVTGVHMSELDSLKGYEAGAIDYIPIPIVPEILRSKVAILVELYRRRAELQRLNAELVQARSQLEEERNQSVAAGHARLLASEARYRAIFENPMARTVVMEAQRDALGRIVDWRYRDANANALEQLQQSHEALLQRSAGELFPGRIDRILEIGAQVLEQRRAHLFEERVGDTDYLMCVFPMGVDTVVSSGVDISARIARERETQRRSHDTLAEKEWLAAVLNSMTEEVYFTDTAKRYTYANPAALREFQHPSVQGIEVERLVATLEVLRADGSPRPLAEAPPLRALQGEVIEGEAQIVRVPRSGELRHRQVSAAPVRDASGQIIGSVSVVRDVTAQRRADEALHLKDARSAALLRLSDRFRGLTEPADLALAASQLLGETIGVSRCGYGTVDSSAETIHIERDWNAPGSPSLAGTLRFRDYGSHIEDLGRGETVVCVDVLTDARTRDKAAYRAIDTRAFVNMPIIEQGRVVALLFLTHAQPRSWTDEELRFIREVAERTRNAVERRRNEQALATDLEVTHLLRDLAARVVPAGNVQDLFEEILGAAISITGSDAGSLQLLDDASETLTFAARRGLDEALVAQFAQVGLASHSSCGQALARRARVSVDFDVPADQDPDGSARAHHATGLVSAQSTPLISRAGHLLGMFTTHWRRRVRLDERRLQALDLLARQAADLIERTRAEQELRETDRRKDEFIAMLAHELRNPLVPIRTGIELLKKAPAQAEVVAKVQPIMERQISHMVRLLDDLLDVSRITAGKIGLQPEPVTLAHLLGSAIEANRAALEEKSLDLQVSMADPKLVLNVDPTRFTQVLSNLLQNAVKFTPAGGRIRVESSLEDTPVQLVLRVTDSGIGITPEVLPRIFDLFAQADSSGRGREAGLGLGLALARRLVQMHGGSIEARSDGRDCGSEFTLRLPSPQQEAPGATPPAAQGMRLAGVRVLVVDDNRDAADVIGLLAEDGGAQVDVVYDGPAALVLLGERVPHVVLLDIGMPDMDGYEVCRRMRALLQDRVRIVALTGWGHEDDRRKALEAGFDAHLTKPADPGKLEELIASLSRGCSP